MIRTFAAAALLCGCAAANGGTWRATDASGRRIDLPAAATRIVSLAPHATEMLFAIGAGAHVVATVEHADHPSAARALPRIGDAFAVNLESLLALEPDLVVLWLSGTSPFVRERLDALGLASFGSEPSRLDAVAAEMLALGALAGVDASGAAAGYRDTLRRAGRSPSALRAFVQIGAPAVFTIGDRHFIGEALALCGAGNAFADLTSPTGQVSREAVLARRPDRFLLMDDLEGGEVERWRALGVRADSILLLPGDLLTRPGPRLASGVQRLCEALDDADRR